MSKPDPHNDAQGNDAQAMRIAALDCLERGFTPIPLRAKSKKAAVKWTEFQTSRPSEEQVVAWFSKPRRGLGVLLGAASNGLVCRDIDRVCSYEEWATAHPEYAELLPTSKTVRGYHVFAAATQESVEEARLRLSVPDDSHGAFDLGDGELRATSGCYVALPPSMHPDGVRYRWVNPLPSGPLPQIDVIAAGFIDRWPTRTSRTRKDERFEGDDSLKWTPNSSSSDTENARGLKSTQRTQDVRSSGGQLNAELSDSSSNDHVASKTPSNASPHAARVEEAIVATLPERYGTRRRRLFDFARRLKAIEEIANLPPERLLPFVKKWFVRAKPRIRTKDLPTTVAGFFEAWERIRVAYGRATLEAAGRRALNGPIPDCVEQIGDAKLSHLAGFCRELQRERGDQPFFLGCRDAGKAIHCGHDLAAISLKLLCRLGVLKVVDLGDRRRAREYRYLPPLD